MGNCFESLRKSTAEITPSDYIKGSPIVTLYGSPNSSLTSYIRIALQYKPVSVHFIPSETTALQYGPDVVSGTPSEMLRCLDVSFPSPRLVSCGEGGRWCGDTPPATVVTAAEIQHRSVVRHVERLVRWVEDMETRGGRDGRGCDPVVGSARMEVRKFGRSYAQLLEVMLEHAQMEERIVFPILEKADRGLTKDANEEHARDLPIMNGIMEDIKAIGVLNSETPSFQEALFNLSVRLKTLQENCKEHFEEEEQKLLPLMEAAELTKEQQERVLLEQCLDVMQGTHTYLFRFFIEGLLPQDAMQYLDLIRRCCDEDRVCSIFRLIID